MEWCGSYYRPVWLLSNHSGEHIFISCWNSKLSNGSSPAECVAHLLSLYALILFGGKTSLQQQEMSLLLMGSLIPLCRNNITANNNNNKFIYIVDDSCHTCHNLYLDSKTVCTLRGVEEQVHRDHYKLQSVFCIQGTRETKQKLSTILSWPHWGY